MEKPTLQQWRTDNPNKSINEYYKAYPDKKAINQNSPTPVVYNRTSNQLNQIQVIPNQLNQVNYIRVEKPKQNINFGDVVFSILGIAGFFMPWLKVNFLGFYNITEATGMQVPDILRLIGYRLPEVVNKSFYAIPICAGIILMGELGRMWFVKLVGIISFVTLSILWLYFLYILSNSSEYNIDVGIRAASDIGLYMVVGSSVYFVLREIYELFN